MCGRFVVARANSELLPLFDIDEAGDDLPVPSYNIAPTQMISVVVDSGKDGVPHRRLAAARWGLVAPFHKSLADGPTPFNARVEKLVSSPLYRGPFARRRAIIPASGFYERRRGDRQSFYIHPDDDSVLAFAGLYEWWRDPTRSDDDPARWLLSATIVTHPPQATMVSIHDREPLYLDPTLWADWLDPATPGDETLLADVQAASTAIAEALEYRRIGPAWLSTAAASRKDNPSLIASS
ncbi:MAG: SOS response-associated peptidase [Propionibacteriaceae bacterium]|jgi:putative SOS response-associated peptidase YedK|nr:SOS response-associated peptidase [Propionibacteriaceae bacterium]